MRPLDPSGAKGGPSTGARLSYAFRLATARAPSPSELTVLEDGLNRRLAQYRTDRAAAETEETAAVPGAEAAAPSAEAATPAAGGKPAEAGKGAEKKESGKDDKKK